MNTKRISPAALHSLKEALSVAFWYKRDLRAFLSTCLRDSELVAHLDWTDYKRSVVGQLVDSMASRQEKYLDELIDLFLATGDIVDPVHLKRLEDGQRLYEQALTALDVLQSHVQPYRRLRTESEEAERRRLEAAARAAMQRAVSVKLSELQSLLFELAASHPQTRGYALERLLNELFELYDVDAKAPFKIAGEQIDGAFTFEGTDFLLEARWRNARARLSDLDAFSGKIGRKLDNTLGLFVSVNGFEESVKATLSQGQPKVLLMDGGDLSAVLEDRIGLPELLTRKRQHAARTGEIYLRAYEILSQ